MADTVTVGCKHPNGLRLDLDEYAVNEKDGKVSIIRGKMGPFILKGWAVPFGMPSMTEGGYRLSEVPADFWAAWYQRNKDSSLILDKVIMPPHKDAVAQARDHDAVPAMFAPRTEADMAKSGVAKAEAA